MIGIELRVDLNKINPEKVYKGKNGAKYYTMTAFIGDETDDFGWQGGVTTKQTKEETDAKAPKHYLGNVKAFWTDGKVVTAERGEGGQTATTNASNDDEEDLGLPF